ncbi:MAG TPA: YihY/virulence factor BrkB family protein [Lutibacter sp.]|nr:YihY/virulence factor BrkB family protein [Lutibacter sp.]
MTKHIEERLSKIPILNILVSLAKKVPLPGLKGMSLYDILEMYITGIVRGALTTRAGGIAFSFLMAIFPFLIFVLTLIPHVPIDGFQEDFLYLMSQWMPPSTSNVVFDNVINYITNHNYGGLLSFYFVLSILLMTNGINAIFGGFEYSYHIKVGRNVIRQYLIALGISILLVLYMLLTVAVAFYFEVGIEKLKDSGWVQDDVFWIVFSQKVFFALMMFISVSTLFYSGTKEGKHHSFFSAGSILTTILFIVLIYLFGIYVAKFSKYNELYGSIGTLLVFMLFIWLNSIILLLGFELNASLHRIKKRLH